MKANSLFRFFLFVLVARLANGVIIAKSERQALTDILTGFGVKSGYLKNWDFKFDCKLWEGLTCDTKGRVIGIEFFDKKFKTLSPSIGKLTALKKLYITESQLKGVIPSSIGSLTQLTELDLQSNFLTGSIPPTIGKLSALYLLSLTSNSLSGFIPNELYKCKKLAIIYLSSNKLSGPISPSISALAELYIIDVYSNQLSGKIPALSSSLKIIGSFNGGSNYFNSFDPKFKKVGFYNSKSDYFTGNCFIDPPEVWQGGSKQKQRPASECAKFCKAGVSQGPCGGNGYCYFKGTTPTCTCNLGFKSSGATCVKA